MPSISFSELSIDDQELVSGFLGHLVAQQVSRGGGLENKASILLQVDRGMDEAQERFSQPDILDKLRQNREKHGLEFVQYDLSFASNFAGKTKKPSADHHRDHPLRRW